MGWEPSFRVNRIIREGLDRKGDLWQDLGRWGFARQVFGGGGWARQESSWRKGVSACPMVGVGRGGGQVPGRAGTVRSQGVWKWLGSDVASSKKSHPQEMQKWPQRIVTHFKN